MRVNLINKAVYNLNKESMTAIPANVFKSLAIKLDPDYEEGKRKTVRLFKTMSDFCDAVASEPDFTMLETEPVYVNENGQIFVTIASPDEDDNKTNE